jgi:hypothetical protein
MSTKTSPRLSLKFVQTAATLTAQVLEQDPATAAKDGSPSRSFTASNGGTIISAYEPELGGCGALYLRGRYTHKDSLTSTRVFDSRAACDEYLGGLIVALREWGATVDGNGDLLRQPAPEPVTSGLEVKNEGGFHELWFKDVLAIRLVELERHLAFQVLAQKPVFTEWLEEQDGFEASNGIQVSSIDSPDLDADDDEVFLRGAESAEDLTLATARFADNIERDEFQNRLVAALTEAVLEFNKEFAPGPELTPAPTAEVAVEEERLGPDTRVLTVTVL